MSTHPRLLIVGGVAGGASAAARARRLSETAQIVVFERGPYVSFANCGLPYHLGGEIAERGDLLRQSPESLGARFNLDVRVRTEVVGIDRDRREVLVRDHAQSREYREGYDALLLAPGATPLKPPIPGIDRPGHFTVRQVPDVDAIQAWLRSQPVRRAVVVGGGYIGLEMAEQMHRRGLEVTVVEALPQVLGGLDPEMAAWVSMELAQHGVRLCLGEPVAAFAEPEKGESAAASVVVLRSGRRLPADVVILAMGVRPEVGLARKAGLAVGSCGGIRVDESLRTNDPHIWAVGDAIEVRHWVTGQPVLLPLAGPANRQGRIAAANMLGGHERYPGSLGTVIVRVFGLVAAGTGASEKMLRALDRRFEAVHLHPPSHAGYYPGASPLSLKLLFDPENGQLLGAQAVGREGVDKRIDVLATAMKAGLSVDEVAELELAYAPPFGSAKDPVNLAGMAAQNVRRGLVRLAQWQEVVALDPTRQMLLDVRTAEEYRAGAIPGAVHIPLHELRQRVAELPRDKEIIVHCQSGQRSYYACRFLAQRGFQVRNLTGSYRTWKAGQSSLQPS